jgi:hypothetical protein
MLNTPTCVCPENPSLHPFRGGIVVLLFLVSGCPEGT